MGIHSLRVNTINCLRGMKRVFGIETEYGITVDGIDNVDVVSESIELVRRYTEHGNLMKWDYSLEDPHQDARGEAFRAAELLQDTDESAYFEIDKNRPLSFRGNQERPRAQQRRAFLQRPRAPGVLHAGMHDAAGTGRAGQGRASASWPSARGGGTKSSCPTARCASTRTTRISSGTATAATTIS